MALDFPTAPSTGDVYGRFTFNGTGWVPTADPAAPFVSKAGDTMTGALELPGAPLTDDEAANKLYVDDSVASGALWRGTWEVATNAPDLTTMTPQNGWSWTCVTADPHVEEATTVALPGVPLGTMIANGDQIRWAVGPPAEFSLIHAAGITVADADARFLRLAGGTMNNNASVGMSMTAAATGNAIELSTASASAAGIWVGNSGSWPGVQVNNTGAGNAMTLGNQPSVAGGEGLRIDNFSIGTGLHVVGRFTSTGNIAMLHNEQTGVGLTQAASGAVTIANTTTDPATVPLTVQGAGVGSATPALQVVEQLTPTTPSFAVRNNGQVSVGTPTGPAVPAAGSVNVQGGYFINGVGANGPAFPQIYPFTATNVPMIPGEQQAPNSFRLSATVPGWTVAERGVVFLRGWYPQPKAPGFVNINNTGDRPLYLRWPMAFATWGGIPAAMMGVPSDPTYIGRRDVDGQSWGGELFLALRFDGAAFYEAENSRVYEYITNLRTGRNPRLSRHNRTMQSPWGVTIPMLQHTLMRIDVPNVSTTMPVYFLAYAHCPQNSDSILGGRGRLRFNTWSVHNRRYTGEIRRLLFRTQGTLTPTLRFQRYQQTQWDRYYDGSPRRFMMTSYTWRVAQRLRGTGTGQANVSGTDILVLLPAYGETEITYRVNRPHYTQFSVDPSMPSTYPDHRFGTGLTSQIDMLDIQAMVAV